MPNYKGHIVGGLVTFVIAFFVLSTFLKTKMPKNYSELFLLLLICVLGALFPDIDIKSKGQRIFYLILLIILTWSVYANNLVILAVASISGFIPLLSRHRGITHRTWFVVLAPLLVPIVASQQNIYLSQKATTAYYFFVAGGLSHLILDFGFIKTLKYSIPKRKKQYRRWK
ncbi:metal-dependent hydrolase [Candidatus Babeliales bacterium]|nr:metal-dependent hydrolase [Candidatus Babeliales bacterium]